MFYEEIRIKQDLPFCPLRILYNSKFILVAVSLGTKAVVVTGVHCSDLSNGSRNRHCEDMQTDLSRLATS